MSGPGELISGAEAVVRTLGSAGVGFAYAYAGTSELALCQQVLAHDGMRLVNARGDKECVFMAAGANLARPHRAVALLHGARGLTNAAGAVGDVWRNEIGVLCLVGLPSRQSTRYLPPHGEPRLVERIGEFAAGAATLSAPEGRGEPDAAGFMDTLRRALARVATRPYGPVLLGLPQDLAEDRWIPESVVAGTWRSPGRSGAPPPAAPPPAAPPDPAAPALSRAAEMVLAAERPAVLLDDYFLRYHDSRTALREFCQASGAAVAQARYRRGPMLFERLTDADVPHFVGWWPADESDDTAGLRDTDLLITLEDRHFYPRVVGELPRCAKIALTTSEQRTRKNNYLSAADVLLAGDPVRSLRALGTLVARRPGPRRERWFVPPGDGRAHPDSTPACTLRAGLVRVLGEALGTVHRPVVVDDSQMFGGLVCDNYSSLPARTRVFGDHGGFVGSGIGYATGLALAEPASTVLCLVGDSALVNGLQGLAMAAGAGLPITFLVCNNGGSVSLRTQAEVSGWDDLVASDYLGNPLTRYAPVAAGFGVATQVVEFGVGPHHGRPASQLERFGAALRDALGAGGPRLVEMVLPSGGEFWADIWRVRGFDEVIPSPGAGAPGVSGVSEG